MKTEKGVIIVAYKETRRNHRYALLKRKKNWEGWELPKGHLEENDYRKTVKIELEEETGINEEDIQEINDMERKVSWEYEEDGEKFKKEYKAFVVKVDEETMIETSKNPCDEHSQGFFFNKEDAESLLEYENNVDILLQAIKNIN